MKKIGQTLGVCVVWAVVGVLTACSGGGPQRANPGVPDLDSDDVVAPDPSSPRPRYVGQDEPSDPEPEPATPSPSATTPG